MKKRGHVDNTRIFMFLCTFTVEFYSHEALRINSLALSSTFFRNDEKKN